MIGVQGNGRGTVKDFLSFAFGLSVSKGGIYTMMDHASKATEAYHSAISTLEVRIACEGTVAPMV